MNDDRSGTLPYVASQSEALMWFDSAVGALEGIISTIEGGSEVGKCLIRCMSVMAFFVMIPCIESILYFLKLGLVLAGSSPSL